MRWMLTILIFLIVILAGIPSLTRFGLGRLPGDINFTIGKHKVCIPLASTVLILLVIFVIGRFV